MNVYKIGKGVCSKRLFWVKENPFAVSGEVVEAIVLKVFVVDDSVMHTYLSPFVAVDNVHERFSQHKFRKVNGYGRVVLRENHLNDDIKLIHKLRLTKLLLLRSRALSCLAERLLCEDEDVFRAETVKPHECTREEREVRVLVDLA